MTNLAFFSAQYNGCEVRIIPDGRVLGSNAITATSVKQPESFYRDKLAKDLKGKTEVSTPAGNIDILTDTEVIEVKNFCAWKAALGQVLAYSLFVKKRKKRIHLYGDITNLTLVKKVCSKYGVSVTHEPQQPVNIEQNDYFPHPIFLNLLKCMGYTDEEAKIIRLYHTMFTRFKQIHSEFVLLLVNQHVNDYEGISFCLNKIYSSLPQPVDAWKFFVIEALAYKEIMTMNIQGKEQCGEVCHEMTQLADVKINSICDLLRESGHIKSQN